MPFEIMFSASGLIAMMGWLVLFFSPLIPEWSDKIAGALLPVLLSVGYLMLLILPATSSGGGFRTLADVIELFSHEQAMLAGWIHFLAFDLFIGAWVCRTARAEGMPFALVAACLPIIFLFGPAGLIAFQTIRAFRSRFSAKSD